MKITTKLLKKLLVEMFKAYEPKGESTNSVLVEFQKTGIEVKTKYDINKVRFYKKGDDWVFNEQNRVKFYTEHWGKRHQQKTKPRSSPPRGAAGGEGVIKSDPVLEWLHVKFLQLDPTTRHMIVQMNMTRCTHRDLAQHYNLTTKGVESRISRAYAKLSKLS